jgi:hypothetical protein
MISEFINQWEENKYKLEYYFKTTKQNEYDSYENIVRKIFELCIPKANKINGWDLKSMTIIDDGDYQGTLIFIIPIDTYQPDLDSYVITNTYYGSCSGCDTLEGISEYSYGTPTDEQVKEYMTLSLHLVQKLKWL